MSYTFAIKMKLKFIRAIAWLALLVAFVFGAYIATMLWRLRPQEVTLSAEPLAIRDDSKALALAREAMLEAGYEPKDFVAGSSIYDIACPDFRRYNFSASPRLPAHPGFHIRLMQDGTNVQITILRRK